MNPLAKEIKRLGSLSPAPAYRNIFEHTAPAGTTAQPSNQGSLKICSSHAIAAAIQEWLDAFKFNAEHDMIVKSLLRNFGTGWASVEPRNPPDFDGHKIKVIEKDPDSRISGREVEVTVSVVTHYPDKKPWVSANTGNDIMTSPRHMLAVGCFESSPKENHTVYLKRYNPSTRMVTTINSHGATGELPTMHDEKFYAVCLIKLSLTDINIWARS